MSALLHLAQSLYLFTPLLLSSLLSALVIHFDWFAAYFRPIDGGHSLGGRRLFGDHKTWRGVVVAVLGCIIGVWVQKHAVPSAWVEQLAVVDYSRANPLAMGAAMGCGATLGELPNSFVKRRLGVAPGATAMGVRAILFFVWDQIDTLTGAWPLLLPWVRPSLPLVSWSFVLALIVHPLSSAVGYLIGVRKSPR